MIYTSYYANHKHYDGFYRIGISRTSPKDSCDIYLKLFAPSYSTLSDYKSKKIEEKEYTRQYLQSLENLYKNGALAVFAEYLKQLNLDIVLLCYESPEKFCHRHILAQVLNKKYGLEIKEL